MTISSNLESLDQKDQIYRIKVRYQGVENTDQLLTIHFLRDDSETFS